VLYNFKCGSDAGNPDSSLIIGPGGVLYGTTAYCGVNNYGTAYQLTPPLTSGGAWTEKVIYTFSAEQAYPFGGVLLSQNTLLGTTYEGGTGGKGTVYELNPPLQTGSPWTVRILYDFSSLDNGFYPFTGLLLSGSTTAFGTTMQGGSRLNGIVFQLTF
jgi:uncharacterized repeat protein (TIGR03803 family)